MSIALVVFGPESIPNITPAILDPVTEATSRVVTPVPPATVVPAGTLSVAPSAGGGAAMVTVDVSARGPPCWAGVTRNVPALLPPGQRPAGAPTPRTPPALPPAVGSPRVVMVPPAAVQVTWGGVDDPSLQEPATVNCCVPPISSDTEAGLRTSCVKLGRAIVTALVSALLPPVCTAIT